MTRDSPHDEFEDDFAMSRRIGDALDNYLAVQGYKEVRGLTEVLACWEDVVGSDVAKSARPRSLRDGELMVLVVHPAWATEIRFRSEMIIEQLATRLGSRTVTRLNVHVEADFGLD